MYGRKVFLGLVVLLLSLSFGAPAYADVGVKTLKEWKGSVADESLMKDAPSFISSRSELEQLWKSWQISTAMPEVDFKENLVILVTTRGSVLRLIATRDEEGNLKVNGMATRDLRPGFRYVIATVNRAGIKSVNGQPLGGTS